MVILFLDCSPCVIFVGENITKLQKKAISILRDKAFRPKLFDILPDKTKNNSVTFVHSFKRNGSPFLIQISKYLSDQINLTRYMSSNFRLSRAYENAKRVTFDDSSKFIFFSDCHRGDNSFADDFANNRNIYFHALSFYFKEGFQYCELGDGDELWENIYFDSIFEAHKNVYGLLRKFYLDRRLHMIWGNHDMAYKDPDYVKENLSSYYEPIDGESKELFEGITYHEAVVLEHKETKQEIFLTHGHQADWWNYKFWRWSRFMVRVLWKPLQVWGIADPTSPAKNYKELIRLERRIKKWIVSKNLLITIVGHTHRPRFPEPGDIPFFNDGSCVHPRSITGIEIENGKISLIKWQISTTEDGTLRVVRVLLEGPQKLIAFQKAKQ